MRVIIRVDSSCAIGSGHLMRCLTLAEKLKKKNAEVHFICRELDGNMNFMVEKKGFFLHGLPRSEDVNDFQGYGAWLTVSQTRDAMESLAIINGIGDIDEVVVDSYAIDEEWEDVIKGCGAKLFVIDDLANRKHNCDYLLDQNFCRNLMNRYSGLVPKNCKMFLGPKYALLREEFYELKKRKKERDGCINNILIFYGGSDLTNETTKALMALDDKDFYHISVDVVVGLSNKHKDEIRQLCETRKNIRYFEQVNNMAALMNEADLMLGAGGTTTWERCFLQLPGIITAVAKNQIEGCIYESQHNLFDYIGTYDIVTSEIIASRIKYLQNNPKYYFDIIDASKRLFE